MDLIGRTVKYVESAIADAKPGGAGAGGRPRSRRATGSCLHTGTGTAGQDSQRPEGPATHQADREDINWCQ